MMSLLHAVDEGIKMCKAEELRLTETIRQCKEFLRAMRICVTDISELEPAGTKDDIMPEEKQEMELLNQVLKKALKIRSTSEAHKELSSDSDISTLPKKSRNKPAVKDEDKRKQVSSEFSSRTLNHRVRSAGGSDARGGMWTRPVLVRKGSSAHPVVKGKQSVRKSAPGKISTTSQAKICDFKTTIAEGPSEDQSTSNSCKPLHEDVPVSDKHQKSNEQWIPSPLLPVWRSQRTKQSRLWNKILTHQSKPVPERAHFTERLRSTFPSERPSGCPADARTKLDVLTQRCLDLTHSFHGELWNQQADQSRPARSEPGATAERWYESTLMLEGLERMTEELLTCADRQKKDWDRWNKCHTETPCPVRRRGEWDEPEGPSLPPVLSYANETELRELETRRLQVEQLQQAVKLHQAMSDSLSSYWTSMDSGTGRPSAVVLRGLYSLLAEGGLQFPSLVLDSESE
ncbi:uncharacterized protein LOC130560987 isoform X2 [Triplophysa rosa]|uniref:Tubulin epsilon and delta complex protein 2 n=1 Tax=Triplophysa rosa TaxID=992332 RepID=A0A9W7TVF8_TRIRA|nr:uncharacterized protein LOC130560987 isoform X2 [Triplophysa rosa]KAI7803288.1 hypothetical protein IRJ41_005041 [Triplophysa rosa]